MGFFSGMYYNIFHSDILSTNRIPLMIIIMNQISIIEIRPQNMINNRMNNLEFIKFYD